MRICQVTLTVGGLGDAAAFYRDVLQLPVAVQTGQVEATVGSSSLVLEDGEPFAGVHHLAFGIAPADFVLAQDWLGERVELIADDGSVVIDGPAGWHSRSLYFLGPEEILLELIARDADAAVPASEGAVPRLLSISEVGIGVPDVAAAVRTLARQLDLPPFPPQGTSFAPVGGHDGLVILVDQERVWFPSYHQPAARGPLVLRVDAPYAAQVDLTPSVRMVASGSAGTGILAQ